MANEPTITITGNLTHDPELRFTTSGLPVASFTIASTPRFRDGATGEWKDGDTWFVRCSAWRDLGQNVAESLGRGSAVVATGRLRPRTYEATPGDPTTKRTVVELTVDDIGPSLRRATAKAVKTTRERPNEGASFGTSTPAANDPWMTGASAPASAPAGNSGGFSDDPPF
ncbi:single-stranded DNA-binding protein [Actinomadura geliboluensis]|uniref:single-stranded DNA-binding protein n=1 Tax=Actinomadura geliboluensis TaxID=882440 RepID=UPI00371724A2